jgi:hypothetical protein
MAALPCVVGLHDERASVARQWYSDGDDISNSAGASIDERVLNGHNRNLFEDARSQRGEPTVSVDRLDPRPVE